jgi:hypothetical protein
MLARRKLERLVQLYELSCADIAPPIKVLDGMPYSLTNKISSMTEDKAVRLSAVRREIDQTTDEIKGYLGDLDRIRKDNVRQMVVLRFLCAYDWQTVRDKAAPDKTVGNVRSTVYWYILNIL